MSFDIPLKLTAPSFLNDSGRKEFDKMEYKMQCFIYYKFVYYYDRKMIQHRLFVKSEKTYMKMNREAKAFVARH